MDATASTLTINGEAGDLITTGDPIAFTANNIRYYFKAHHALWLDGTDQDIDVFIRPRKTISGLNISVNRMKPTARFLIDINATGGRTGMNRFTNYSLIGIEYWGAV